MPKDNKNSNIEVLKLIGNKVNIRIITLIRRHPMSPRDLSRYLNKKEGDIVRRLKAMEKHGLVKGSWGTRLGHNVKLYSLVAHDISVSLRQNGLQIAFPKEKREKQPQRTTIEASATSLTSNAVEEEEPQEQKDFPIVGRDNELKLIHNSEKANFFFIVGIAGIGKTSFARKYVQESSITRGNVFWHTFKEIDTFSYVVSRLALFLSKHGSDDLIKQVDLSTLGTVALEDNQSNILEILVKSLNRIRGCILIFDDFHKVRDEKISVLIKYMQAKLSPTNKILALSRSKAPFYLDNMHGREIILGGLTLADSKEVVLQLGTDIGDIALLNIWRRFAGHPMALKLFCMLQEHAERTEIRPSPFTRQDNNLSIEELFAYFKKEILEVLNQDELSILMSLSVFRSPVKIQAISHGISSNKRNLNYLLYSLEKKMIVNKTNNQEFFLHDMLKDILYSMLAYPDEAHASAARYYLTRQTVQDIIEAIYHLIKARDVLNVISIISEEIEQERYRMLEAGYAGPLLEILNQISTSAIKDKKSLIHLLNIEGKAYAVMEKWQESKERLDQALQIAQKLDAGTSDKNITIAYTKKILGEALYLKGEFTQVEKNLLEAANIFKSLQMQEPLKGIYMKLARMYFATGRTEKSQRYSDLAMAISVH